MGNTFVQLFCLHISDLIKTVESVSEPNFRGGTNDGTTSDWLSEVFADEGLRSKLIKAVKELDTHPISAVMDLLAQVRPSEKYPRTIAGI
jgi:hypothetical protein